MTDAISMSTTSVRMRRLSRRAALPEYKTPLAAGMDLAACLPSDTDEITLAAGGGRALIPTGIAMALEPGYEAQVRPRSGLGSKHGVTVVNAPGTIDADYRGELMVALVNLGPEPFTITHGLRIAQMVIAPVSRAAIVEVEELDDTERGAGGFGSTGL